MGDDFYQRFSEQYDAGKSQIVWRRIVADLETPVGTYLKLAQGRVLIACVTPRVVTLAPLIQPR